MRPEQFTMWLRGVMDGVRTPEGGLSEATTQMIHAKLTEVVAKQVANRFEELNARELVPEPTNQYIPTRTAPIWSTDAAETLAAPSFLYNALQGGEKAA